VRGMVNFVLNRLPLADLMAQWQQGRAAETAVAPGAPDPALRALLTQRIGETLQDAATPSRKPLYIAMAVQAALLALGMWLTR
jgi:p-aminobenzoyl-glutamate transporter AbgT